MGRHNDNKNIVEKKYYDIVFTQLKKWKINFHSLTLGKPSSDYYIDDKCVTFNKNWLNIIKKNFYYEYSFTILVNLVRILLSLKFQSLRFIFLQSKSFSDSSCK